MSTITIPLSTLPYGSPTLIGKIGNTINLYTPNFPPELGAGHKKNYCTYSPLIDAKSVTGGTLIRITLLVDSSISSVTVPATVPPNNTLSNPELSTDGSTLKYYLECQTGIAPTGIINLWYLELFTSHDVKHVEAFLYSKDPQLSRGTVTTVQPAG